MGGVTTRRGYYLKKQSTLFYSIVRSLDFSSTMLQLKYFHEHILANQKLLSFFIRWLFLPRIEVHKDDRREAYKSTTIAMTELALETKKSLLVNSYVTGLFRRERTNAPIFAMIRDRLKFRSDSRLPSLGSVEPLPRIPRQRDQLAKLRNRLFYRESPARLRSESWSSLISPALKRLPRDRVKSVGFVNEADARRSYASFASVCFWNTWRIRRCLEGVPCCQSKLS